MGIDTYDIASFPSPSPPPGLELGPSGAGIQREESQSRDGKGKSRHKVQKRTSIPAKRKSMASIKPPIFLKSARADTCHLL